MMKSFWDRFVGPRVPPFSLVPNHWSLAGPVGHKQPFDGPKGTEEHPQDGLLMDDWSLRQATATDVCPSLYQKVGLTIVFSLRINNARGIVEDVCKVGLEVCRLLIQRLHRWSKGLVIQSICLQDPSHCRSFALCRSKTVVRSFGHECLILISPRAGLRKLSVEDVDVAVELDRQGKGGLFNNDSRNFGLVHSNNR